MMSEWMIYARALIALVFVTGLIFLLAALVKKTGLDKKWTGNKSGVQRLSVIETLYLDPKRRLVLIRADTKEHLLLLGATGDLHIESSEQKKSHVA